jgi:hypothetical protein
MVSADWSTGAATLLGDEEGSSSLFEFHGAAEQLVRLVSDCDAPGRNHRGTRKPRRRILMKKSMLLLLSLLLLVFLGVTSVVAEEGEKLAGQVSQTVEKAGSREKAKGGAAKLETISGTITAVHKENQLLILTSSSGIPYNFKLTRSSRIEIGGQKGKFDDLANQTGKQASVEFLPLRGGNVARSVKVGQ